MGAVPLSQARSRLLVGTASRWLGRQPFAAMVARNTALADAVARGEALGEVTFFEPAEAVYALGRRAQDAQARADIASSLVACAARQIAIVEVDRGGLGTLHAPGQIVAFLALRCSRWQARELGDDLLRGIKALARDRGVDARCDLGDDVGVWSPAGKLASLGMRLRDDVAQHGVALNVAVDPCLAQGLVLCGKPWIHLANLDDAPDVARGNLAGWSQALAEKWQLLPPHAEAGEFA